MKKIYILSISILITCSAFSQAYKPMLKENKTWEDIHEYWNQLTFQNFSFEYSIYYINGDSIVSGTQYQKLYSHDTTIMGAGNDFASNGSPTLYPSQNNGYRLIREDTSTRKIWLRHQFSFDTTNREVLLYDFSVNIGDTMQSINMWAWNPSTIYSHAIVNNIGLTTLNNNETSRIFYVTPIDFGNMFQSSFFIIEGVGSPHSFLNPFEMVFEHTAWLTCVKDSGINIYDGSQWISGGFQCGTILSADDNKIDIQSFKLYPNPNNGENILISGEDLNLIKIYNIHGQLIKTIVIENDKIELTFETYPKGIYLVKAQFTNGEIVTKKLMLTR